MPLINVYCVCTKCHKQIDPIHSTRHALESATEYTFVCHNKFEIIILEDKMFIESNNNILISLFKEGFTISDSLALLNALLDYYDDDILNYVYERILKRMRNEMPKNIFDQLALNVNTFRLSPRMLIESRLPFLIRRSQQLGY